MDNFTESSGIDTSPDMNSSSDMPEDFQSPDRLSLMKPRTLTYDESDDMPDTRCHRGTHLNHNNNNLSSKLMDDDDEIPLHRPHLIRGSALLRSNVRPPPLVLPSKLNLESPPYRKVRALRLFDTPATPKTIIQKCSADILPKQNNTKPADAVPSTPIVLERPKAIPIHNKVLDSITANINPFSPTSGFLQNKKRLRNEDSFARNHITNSTESLVNKSSSSINSVNEDLPFDTIPNDDERQAPKRLALQDSNIPRYEKEFLELSLIGVGEFGVAYQCLNRLDGCVYAIKKSIKPVAGSVFE